MSMARNKLVLYLAYRSLCMILPLIVMAVMLSCSHSTDSEQTSFEKNRELWESQNLTHYVFYFEQACFCAPRHLAASVQVRNDTVFNFSNVYGDGELLTDTLISAYGISRSSFHSIEGLFDIIQNAMDKNADLLQVKYNPQIGYPETTHVDFSFGVADEEISYYARGVVGQ